MEVEFTFLEPAHGGAGPRRGHAASPLSLTAIEDAGFRRILPPRQLRMTRLGEEVLAQDGDLVVGWCHEPGRVDPVSAAREIAALDLIASGRLEVTVEAIPADAEERFGLTSHVARMQFLDEYLTVLKRLWASEAAFEHQGRYFSLPCGYVPRKGPSGSNIALRMSGVTGSGTRVAARHASVLELDAVSPEHARRHIARVREIAGVFGRANRIRFALRVSFSSDDDSEEIVLLAQRPEDVALSLMPYAEAGIAEFVVSGLRDDGDLARFARTVRPLLANSIRRVVPVTRGATSRRAAR